MAHHEAGEFTGKIPNIANSGEKKRKNPTRIFLIQAIKL